jgi:hypothetical protein
MRVRTTNASLIDERTNNSKTTDGRPTRVLVSDEDRTEFLKICRLTANALAADRSTKFLPVMSSTAIRNAFFRVLLSEEHQNSFPEARYNLATCH